MPRLTDSTYLKQRRTLVEYWQEGGHSFIFLRYIDQLTLHEYYRPAEDLSDHEALAHRRRAGHESPSLPQRAGKIYALLLREIALEQERRRHPQPAAPIRRVGRRRVYNIRVRGLAHPKPDYDKLARALLEHARNEAEKATSTDQDTDAA